MEFDVVVVGAGHNSLACAAYLADAGLSVVVLEAASEIGGNTRTDELTLPGWRHDACSSSHVAIQSNPLIAEDELGLLSVEGLRYRTPDPAMLFPLENGDALVLRPDFDATVAEFQRFSPADADALKSMTTEWTSLAPAHARDQAGLTPLGDDASASYHALRARRARDVIDDAFEHPVIRTAVSSVALTSFRPLTYPGTGALPSANLAARLSHSGAIPVGGSGALASALVSALIRRGGAVVTRATVRRYLVESGRCVGVVSDDGEFRARRAVVTGAHLATLPVALDGASAALEEAADRWRAGLAVFSVHLALRDHPRYSTRHGSSPSVAAILGSAEGADRQVAAALDGQLRDDDPWMMLVDADAASAGGEPRCALKFLTFAPTHVKGRPWSSDDGESFADRLVSVARARVAGLDAVDVVARRVDSPTTLAARSPSNLAGSCHGGEFLLRDGTVVWGWPGSRTDVDGLYLTGSTSHPGGSVSAWPGRNAARDVLADLGIDSVALRPFV